MLELDDKIQHLPGSTEVRDFVAKTSLAYLDSLAQEAAGEAALELELAPAYRKVGDVQGLSAARLGHTEAAQQSYRKSVSLAEKLGARDATNPAHRRALAASYFKLGALQTGYDWNNPAVLATLRTGLCVAELRARPGADQQRDLRTDEMNSKAKTGGFFASTWQRSLPNSLRGFADLHTHPMVNLAFGGKLIHGGNDVGALLPADSKCQPKVRAKSMEHALGTDNSTHGGHGVPAWSPDSQRIAFVSYLPGRAEIGTVQTDGSDFQSLVNGGANFYDPVFALDGNFVFWTTGAGNFQLWRRPVSPTTGKPAGAAEEIANTGAALARYLTIAGKRLAYSSLMMANNIGSVAVSPQTGAATSTPILLTQDTNRRKTAPSFSADGSRIVYSLWRAGGAGELWLLDTNGSNPRQLTAGWPACRIGCPMASASAWCRKTALTCGCGRWR